MHWYNGPTSSSFVINAYINVLSIFFILLEEKFTVTAVSKTPVWKTDWPLVVLQKNWCFFFDVARHLNENTVLPQYTVSCQTFAGVFSCWKNTWTFTKLCDHKAQGQFKNYTSLFWYE